MKTTARQGSGQRKSFFILLAVIILTASVVHPFRLGRAQDAAPGIWHVQNIVAKDSGVSNPAGIAFSTQANVFEILEKGPASATTQVLRVASKTSPAGIDKIPAAIPNPLNIAFDNKANRFLFLANANTQIVAVQAGADGSLNPSSLTRRAVRSLGLVDPQGMAMDDSSGDIFILDASGPRIFRLQLDTGTFSTADLAASGLSAPRGLALDPSTGHLHTLAPASGLLYEFTQAGGMVDTRDTSTFDLSEPQGMVFAPSSDQTDDPSQMNLFIADASATTTSQGQIMELTLVAPASLPAGTQMLPATLVRTFQTANWTYPAPDPSALDYWAAEGKLVITDSEVEEYVGKNPPAYWHGYNVFISTLSGSLTGNCTTYTKNPGSVLWNDFTGEPSGFAINFDNGHFFFSSDGRSSKVYDLGFGADGKYCTPDDKVTRVAVNNIYNTSDSEDVAYGQNTIFIADGVNAEVYRIPLGPDGLFGTSDDGPMTHWDTAALGFHDLEGIGYNADNGTLFIVSTQGSENYLGETSFSGTLLRAYDLSFMGTQGNIRSDVALAPSSYDPSRKSIYIASRGVDNNSNRLENDGQIWEINIGSNSLPTATTGPSITPSATATTGPSPTPTNTLTPSPTATIGPSATPTDTATPTNTPAVSDLIFADGFESGDFSAWSNSSTDAGDLSASATAALVGSQGLQAVVNDNNAMYVQDDSLASEPRYRARFYFDPNSISMASGDSHPILIGYSGSAAMRVVFRYYNGAYQLRLAAVNDAGTWAYSTWFSISDAPHVVEFDWAAATTAGGNDGYVTLWVDGSQAPSLTGITNSTKRMDRVRLGPVTGVDAGTRGSYYFDAFESRRQSYIGP